MSSSRVGQEVLLVGFARSEAGRLAHVLSEAGHRAHVVGGLEDLRALLGRLQVHLGLVDLEGAFADVLGAIWAIRDSSRQGCPLLGVGAAQAGVAAASALRALGFGGLVPRNATPQELIFRVNRILYAGLPGAAQISRRVPVDLPASFDGPGGPARGTILNISETGLFLSASELLPTNRSVNVRFPLEPGAPPIVATCRVVWTNAGGQAQRYFKGMGMQFLEMQPPARARLQRFLARAIERLDAEPVDATSAAERRPAASGVAEHGDAGLRA